VTGRRRASPRLPRLARLTVNQGGATLLAIGFVDSIGTGLYLAGSAIFFTHVVGLSAARVGLGLSLAGLLGLVSQPVIGWLADRWGPRRVLLLLNLWRAAGFTAYVFTDSFLMFMIVAALLGIGDHAVYPIYQALVERVVGLTQRVGMMAQVRVVDNIGYTFGALLATVAISHGTRPVFNAIMLGNALTFVIAAALLPRVRLLPVTGGSNDASAPHAPLRLHALRDGWYVALAAVNGILVLHMVLLGIAVPLWVTLHTSAPPALVGILLVVNTALAVLLQVRVARGSEALQGGVTALRRGGVALAVCCGLLALAPLWDETALVVLTLVLGVVALTAGELFQSAGGWSLSYLLAPTRSRAEYLATFNLGTSMQLVLGPMLVTVGIVGNGSFGWLGLAGCFLMAAAAVGPLAAGAARRPALATMDSKRNPAWRGPPKPLPSEQAG
jgi:MFS family permease